MQFEPTDVAIEVQHLSKLYVLGESINQFSTLRDKVAATFKTPFQKLKKSNFIPKQPKAETLWALNDVSFEVKHGEVVGIIGHNGAGKSTTINMLVGLLRPSAGQCLITGIDIWANPLAAKKRLGVMPEGTQMYQRLSAREFIRER